MGVMSATWPRGQSDPFGVRSDWSWRDIGILFKIISDYKVGLMIETAVGHGDIAAWAISKSLFDDAFHYLGVTNDLSIISSNIYSVILHSQTSSIVAGAACSSVMKSRIGKLIHNSYKPVIVLCDGIDKTREIEQFLALMRPGDVVVSDVSPVGTSLRVIQSLVNKGKIKWIGDRSIFAGEVL